MTLPTSPRFPPLQRLLAPIAAAAFLAPCAALSAQQASVEPGGERRDFGPGIASQYPGDEGLEKDPRVLLVERFEEATREDLLRRWDDARRPGDLSLVKDSAPGSSGKQCLLMTHVGGESEGTHLYTRLPRGVEEAFARFYVRFDPDCAPLHHFGTCLGGNTPATAWPQVKAGIRPAGDKTFWVGVEPFGKSWTWDFYAYWCEMRGSPPRGQTWGNSFIENSELKVERGRWISIELMIRLNDPSKHDGELALWIDGKKVSHLGPGFPRGLWVFDNFIPGKGGEGVRWNDEKGDRETVRAPEGGAPFEGFRWRASPKLDINYVWAYIYLTKVPPGHVSKVYFDEIVVATSYIGPIRPR